MVTAAYRARQLSQKTGRKIVAIPADLTKAATHFQALVTAETENRPIYELGNGQWDIPALRTLLEDIVPESTVFNDFVLEHDFPHIGRRTMRLNARRIPQKDPQQRSLLLAIEDITERRKRCSGVLQQGLLIDFIADAGQVRGQETIRVLDWNRDSRRGRLIRKKVFVRLARDKERLDVNLREVSAAGAGGRELGQRSANAAGEAVMHGGSGSREW